MRYSDLYNKNIYLDFVALAGTELPKPLEHLGISVNSDKGIFFIH